MGAPLDLIFGDDFGTGLGPSPIPPEPCVTLPGGMRPFSRFLYRDCIRIRRRVLVESEGSDVVAYPDEPEPAELANVQTETERRIDPDSRRVTTATMYLVYTRTNRSLRPDDQIEYEDRSGANHTLTVIAASMPRGIGDVSYLTQCIEVS